MRWSIVVETEDAPAERAAGPFDELGDAVIYALGLADALGAIAPELRGHRVNINRDDGLLELSIAVIPGGLDPG